MGRGAHERLGRKLWSAALDLKFSLMGVLVGHNTLYICERYVLESLARSRFVLQINLQHWDMHTSGDDSCIAISLLPKRICIHVSKAIEVIQH